MLSLLQPPTTVYSLRLSLVFCLLTWNFVSLEEMATRFRSPLPMRAPSRLSARRTQPSQCCVAKWRMSSLPAGSKWPPWMATTQLQLLHGVVDLRLEQSLHPRSLRALLQQEHHWLQQRQGHLQCVQEQVEHPASLHTFSSMCRMSDRRESTSPAGGEYCSDLAILQDSAVFGNPGLHISSCFLSVHARLYLRQQVEYLHRHPVPTTYMSV